MQGLTQRSERHLHVGQVYVMMFYLPSAYGHLPPKNVLLYILHYDPYFLVTILCHGKF